MPVTYKTGLRAAAAILAFVVLAIPIPAAVAAEQAILVNLAVSSTSLAIGAIQIGEKGGLFAKKGLVLKTTVMDSGNAAMAALLSGSVQFAAAGPPEALAARARGQDVVIAANLYRGFAGCVVMSKAAAAKLNVRADASVKDRLRALNGLVVAVPSPTSTLFGPINAAAASVGAKPRYTYLGQQAMVAALESNAIDAMVASSPFSGAPVLKGTGILWLNGPGGDFPADVSPASSECLLTTGAAAAANAEVIRRFRAALDDVAVLIKQRPDEAKRALASAYPQLEPAAVDLAFSQQADNWTHPQFSEADVRQQIKLLQAASRLPGLDKLQPQALLLNNP